MPETHTAASVARKLRTLLMLASILNMAPFLTAADPPSDLVRRVAAREAQMEQERSHYTYRQSVKIEEFPDRGGRPGEYREMRDVIFSPSGERTERMVGKPVLNLVRLKLTDEDFRDIREVQPFVLAQDQVRLYESRYKGEETIDGVECFVLDVKPKQILMDQRLFEGLLWASQADFSVIRMQGRAVPQHLGKSAENLFPRFPTVSERLDGSTSFP